MRTAAAERYRRDLMAASFTSTGTPLPVTAASVLRVLLVVRVVGLAGMVLALGLRAGDLDRLPVGLGVVALAGLMTLANRWMLDHRPGGLMEPTWIVADLVTAAALLGADGWVFGPDSVSLPPLLGAVWPAAAIVQIGWLAGPVAGAIAGVGVGLARLAGRVAPELLTAREKILEDPDPPLLVPIVAVVLAVGAIGGTAGAVSRAVARSLRRESDREIRREIAANLHDGVLQTLAVIARRSTDPDAAELARDADRELRGYLSQDFAAEPTDLRAALAAVCRNAERAHQLHVTYAPDPDLPRRPVDVVTAVAGAAAEALANVAKHAAATRTTVYAAPDDDEQGLIVVITDDGCGFDPATTARRGLRHSISARIDALGGNTTITSTPGNGTEVQLWIP